MVEFIPIENMKCPECGENMFHKELSEKGVYYCGKPLEEFELNNNKYYVRCGHLQVYCESCKKIRDQISFRNDNGCYRCIYCDTISPSLTEYYAKNDIVRRKVLSILGR